MSAHTRFDTFVEALCALCRAHNVTLRPSLFDPLSIIVDDLGKHEKPIADDVLVDVTSASDSAPVVPFDAVAVRVAPDGSIGLAFIKNGREMFFSDTRHLTHGDVLNVSGVVGSLRITSK